MTKAFVAVDSEGDAGSRGLMSMSWYDGDAYGYTESHDEMRTVLRYYAQNGYDFLCHNAEYDIAVLFWQLELPVEVEMYSGRFHHGQWRIANRRTLCRVWDTAALAAFLPLGSVGDALQMSKYPTPQILTSGEVERYKWQCDKHRRWECLDCYAVRDAEITFRYFEFYRSLMDRFLLPPKHTLGASAVAIWRTLDQPENVAILSGRVEELARCAYRGGRTELFKPGDHRDIYEADVNSMYPFVMSTYPYPDMSAVRYRIGNSVPDGVFDCEGVTEAEIYVPSTYIPVLGVVRDGFSYYPTGELRGAWTHAEIRAAIERGAKVKRVLRSLWSERNCFPFTNFVTSLWQLKEEYDRTGNPLRLVVKIILNALYGRLGLSPGQIRRKVLPVSMAPRGRNADGWQLGEGFPPTYAHRDYEMRKLSPNANVLWAAQTTALARLELVRHLESAGSGVIYCDTDSVFSLNPVGTDDRAMGALQAKGQWRSAHFAAPKLYELHAYGGSAKTRAKGVPKSVAADYLANGYASFKRPTRLLEALSNGGTAGEWVEIKKERMLIPARRQPVNPERLESGGWSDSLPVFLESAADCELPWSK